jgi:hypothetical protein
MDQPQQSPSTGESTRNQHKQEPARSDLPERPDVLRPSSEPPPQHGGKGPKSGGMGPKQ